MAPLSSSWMWKVLPRCAREITSRRFRKQIIAWRKDYGSYPYKYFNAVIGLLSYLAATATGKTWEDQVNSEILQPLGNADTTLNNGSAWHKDITVHVRMRRNSRSSHGTLPTDCARQHMT
jgi:CubicO group peptidase (beta-lactamase class C family)